MGENTPQSTTSRFPISVVPLAAVSIGTGCLQVLEELVLSSDRLTIRALTERLFDVDKKGISGGAESAGLSGRPDTGRKFSFCKRLAL